MSLISYLRNELYYWFELSQTLFRANAEDKDKGMT